MILKELHEKFKGTTFNAIIMFEEEQVVIFVTPNLDSNKNIKPVKWIGTPEEIDKIVSEGINELKINLPETISDIKSLQDSLNKKKVDMAKSKASPQKKEEKKDTGPKLF